MGCLKAGIGLCCWVQSWDQSACPPRMRVSRSPFDPRSEISRLSRLGDRIRLIRSTLRGRSPNATLREFAPPGPAGLAGLAGADEGDLSPRRKGANLSIGLWAYVVGSPGTDHDHSVLRVRQRAVRPPGPGSCNHPAGGRSASILPGGLQVRSGRTPREFSGNGATDRQRCTAGTWARDRGGGSRPCRSAFEIALFVQILGDVEQNGSHKWERPAAHR